MPAAVERRNFKRVAVNRPLKDDGNARLFVGRARFVTKTQAKLVVAFDLVAGSLAFVFFGIPIDSLGEHCRALGDRRHRVDFNAAGNAQFVDDSVAQRLVVDGAADKNYSVNVVRLQARLVNRRPRSFNRLGHGIVNHRVEVFAIERHVKINFFAVFVLNVCFALDFRFVVGRKFNLRLFRHMRRDAQQSFVFVKRAPIVGHGVIFLKPRHDEFVQDDFVEVTPAAHGQAAVRKEIHFAANPLGNRNVKRAAAHVEDQKFAVGLIVLHDAKNRRNGLLHECDFAQARLLCRVECGSVLHLIERRRNRYNRADLIFVSANVVGQIFEQLTKNFSTALFRSKFVVVDCELRACAHESLEENRATFGLNERVFVSLRAIVTMTALVDVNRRRQHVRLPAFGFAHADIFAVERGNRAVGRAQVNADKIFHAFRLPKTAVPSLTISAESLRFIVGSSIASTNKFSSAAKSAKFIGVIGKPVSNSAPVKSANSKPSSAAARTNFLSKRAT